MNVTQTLLDKFINTCETGSDLLPVYLHMKQVILETHPVAYKWDKPELTVHLPDKAFDWPHAAMCLFTPGGILQHSYKLCIEQGYVRNDTAAWFEKMKWRIDGVLLFQLSNNEFEVIPLLMETGRQIIVMPEIQLHFTFNDRWVWEKATTGPVNNLFHNVFCRAFDTDAEQQFTEDIEYLGNLVSLYLGSYYVHINNPGHWAIHLAKEPKLKIKNGVTKKTYRDGTTGYTQFIPKE